MSLVKLSLGPGFTNTWLDFVMTMTTSWERWLGICDRRRRRVCRKFVSGSYSVSCLTTAGPRSRCVTRRTSTATLYRASSPRVIATWRWNPSPDFNGPSRIARLPGNIAYITMLCQNIPDFKINTIKERLKVVRNYPLLRLSFTT